MRVLVTGGTGSIGGAVVRALLQCEHTVLALGRSPEACRTLELLGANPLEGDLREQAQRGDEYNAAAIEGVSIGLLTRTIASRLGIDTDPVVIDIESARAEFGSSAPGYALDQQMSGQKAIDRLGWQPRHLDVIADIA